MNLNSVFIRPPHLYVVPLLILSLTACNSSGGYDHGNDNRAPVAVADTASTLDMGPVTVAVLDNDSDPDSDSLTLSSVGAASHGTAAISDNHVVYTPTQPFSGDDSFSYSVADTYGHSVHGNVTIHRSNSPVAASDEVSLSSLHSVSASVLSNDTDLDGGILTLTEVGSSEFASVVLSGGQVVYTPTKTLSGDDHVSYTVADAQGHTATGTLTVHADTALHLQGSVVSGAGQPLPNAVLSVAAGSVHLDAVAKDDGSFDIALSGISSSATGLVSIEASGAATLGKIKLAAYIGDYADLYKQGGSTHTVNSSSNSMLYVSPLSTAWVANADVTNGAPLTDNATFLRLESEIDTSNLYSTAALIQIAAVAIKVNTPGLQLPTGVADTLALVRAPANFTAYFGQVTQTDNSLIGTTTASIQADPVLNMPINEHDMTGQFYYFNSGEILTLQNGNTGNVTWGNSAFGLTATYAHAAGFAWSVSSPQLTVSPTSNVLIQQSFILSGGGGYLVEQDTYFTGLDIRVLARQHNQLIISRAVHTHTSTPDHSVPDFDTTGPYQTVVAFTSGAMVKFTETEMPGTWHLPVMALINASTIMIPDGTGGTQQIATTNVASSTDFVFDADHSVSMPLANKYAQGHLASSGSWSIDANGLLHVTYDDPQTGHAIDARYTRLTMSGTAGMFSLKLVDNVNKTAVSTSSVGGRVNADAAWQDASVAGIYSLGQDPLIGLNHFWFELKADHTGNYIFVTDHANNGVLESNDYFIHPVVWSVDANGVLAISRYYDKFTFARCLPAPENPNCVRYQTRYLTVIDRVDNKIQFSRDLQIDYWFDLTDGFVLTDELTDMFTWVQLTERPLPLPALKTSNVPKSTGKSDNWNRKAGLDVK